MKDRDSSPALKSSPAPSSLSAVRRQEITRSMLASGVSVNDLVRRTGFLKHQVQAAIAGKSEITEATYKALMRAISDTSQFRRDVAQGDFA